MIQKVLGNLQKVKAGGKNVNPGNLPIFIMILIFLRNFSSFKIFFRENDLLD